jgi:GT2 family glycosyltransferase
VKPGYQARPRPEYFTDAPTPAITYQPEVYDFAADLAKRADCRQIIDIGCGNGNKLVALYPRFDVTGIDYGPNILHCRTAHPGQWLEADFENPLTCLEPRDASDALLVCSDVVEHLVDPLPLLRSIRSLLEFAPYAILSTPERDLERGTSDYGPPANPAHVREWNLTEFAALLEHADLHVDQIGLTISNSQEGQKKTILAVVTAPSAAPRTDPPSSFDVLAIMCAYNEADIVDESIRRLLLDGVRVHVIDNWSTDRTYEIVRSLAADHVGRVSVERFPDRAASATYDWQALLERVEAVAAGSSAAWVVHHDVDEYRTSPWRGVGLRAGLWAAQCAGYSAVDFKVLDHRLTAAEGFEAGVDFVDFFRYFDFGDETADDLQVKAWLNTGRRVRLADEGGHNATFNGRRLYPYKFELHHYSIRSQLHGERKVHRDRQARWNPAERDRGWHIQYDAVEPGHDFVRDPASLIEWDPREPKNFHTSYIVERLTSRKPWSPGSEPEPVASARPIDEPDSLSIVLPVVTGTGSTLTRQLEALVASADRPVDLVLVNAAEDLATRLIIDGLRGDVSVVDVDASSTTAGMWNAGAVRAFGDFLAFLRPGCVVAPGWIAPMLEVLSDPATGLVGAVTITPNGRVSSAGGALVLTESSNGDGSLIGAALHAGGALEAVVSDEPLAASVLPGALVACRLECYLEIGGFHEQYRHDYETVDASLAVRATGRSNMLQPLSIVLHEASARPVSLGDDNPDMDRLTRRWLGRVDPDYLLAANGELRQCPTPLLAPLKTSRATATVGIG